MASGSLPRTADGSDPGAANKTGTKRRRRTTDEEDEAIIEKPVTFDDFEEFSEDNDVTPDDRRRDPLRKNL